MFRRAFAAIALGSTLVTALANPSCTTPDTEVRARDSGMPDVSVTVDAAPDAEAVDSGLVCPFPRSRATTPKRPLDILLFTKETQFFHTASHDSGEALVPKALRDRGHVVVVSDDVATFTDVRLARFDVIVFFVTSGRVLTDPAHRAALVRFIHRGKGIAGAHTATATDLDWFDEEGRRYFMDEMWGGSFKGHGGWPSGNVTDAGLIVSDASPLTSFLPQPWIRRDEWYYYHTNPALRAEVRPIVWLDESWIEPFKGDYPEEGFYGEAGHPISWTKEFECARIFYTAMGHTGETWTEDLVVKHFVAGIEWAGAPSSEH